MQVTDDRRFDLIEPLANGWNAPEKWERGRIVAEQQNALIRFQRGKRRVDFLQVLATQLFPLRSLRRQRFGFEHRKRQERRHDAEQDVTARFEFPERIEPEFRPGAM